VLKHAGTNTQALPTGLVSCGLTMPLARILPVMFAQSPRGLPIPPSSVLDLTVEWPPLPSAVALPELYRNPLDSYAKQPAAWSLAVTPQQRSAQSHCVGT